MTATHLAIDIGGTKVALACGGLEQSVHWATTSDAAADVARLLDAVQRAVAGRTVDRVGVSLAATLDDGGVVVAWPNRPWWVGVDVRRTLETSTAAPVAIADDGTLAALAEARAAGVDDLVYLGIGTGIGGGLIVGGRPVTGMHGRAGELGHVPVDPAGPACRCGRSGCVQAIASGPATLALASSLRGAPVAPGELPNAVRDAAPWAIDAVRTAASALARLVVVLQETLDPARVHVGGGHAVAIPTLVPWVIEELATLTRPSCDPVAIHPALLGERSSLVGAALLADEPGALSGRPA